jgi:endonuclease/exonuclease/phosphatase family metal-dependent hydrolase
MRIHPTPLKALTYNIHHGRGLDRVLDLERIAAMIDESGADLIGLQEVDKHWSSRSDWEDQPAWFAKRLDMHLAYAANLDLPPLNPGEEQRWLLEATIKVRGKDLLFADTHLTSSNNAERLDQAKRVVELLGASKQPTVLVGDLNARPAAPEITTLTAHWRDTWAEVGVGPGYTIEADNPTARIDYVLHSGGVLARSAEVITTYGSDHLPVFAELSLR